MKRLVKYLLVAVVVVATLAAMTTALACTGYYVGKDVSEDGTYIIGHTVDASNTAQARIVVVEGSTEPGRYFTVGDTEVPLPDVTYQYTSMPSMFVDTWANAASNEYGLSMTGSVTTFISDEMMEADPYTTDGCAESWVCAYIAATCTTAREAVEMYGELMETYGSSESNTFLISDQNEAWYLESYSGHQWCAVKCPDDCVAVFGNECMLGTLEDYVEGETLFHSEDFYTLPEEAGLAVYDEDGNFDVFESYCGDDILEDYSNLRTWYGHFLLAPSTAGEYDTMTRYDLFYEPDEVVTLEDIFSLTRSRYQGTEYDPDESGEAVRIIGIERQESCAVIETYPDLPAAMCVVTWNTITNAEHSVYLPMSNLVTTVADMYTVRPDDYSSGYRLDIACTHFKRLCALSEQDRNLYGAGVRAYWESVEAELVEEMPSVLADLEDLYAEDPEAAAESITDYTIQLQKQALEDADTMYDELTWYMISNTISYPDDVPDPFVPSLLVTDEEDAEEEATSGEAASEEAASEEAAVVSLVFTYPEDIPAEDVTVELYEGFPTSSSKTLEDMIADGDLTLIEAEEDGSYVISAAGVYSYHISGDGYYNILKIFNVTDDDVENGAMEVEVTGGPLGETDGYQPTVEPENAPDTYTMDARDAMLCIWPDEVLEHFTVEDQGYETPAFDGTDAAHEVTTQEEMEEFLADRAEDCDYMYLYSAGTTPNYEFDIPLAIFTETEIPEGATLEEAAALVSDNGKPTVWYQAQIHPNEPAAGEGALVIIDDFVYDEETAALLDSVNVVIAPRVNPDGAYLFTRVTYDGFDMNRDHMALKADELAQLHAAYQLFMAEVVIDGHEFTFYGASEDGYMRNADDVETSSATSLNDDDAITELSLAMTGYAFETAEDAGLRIYHYGTTVNNPIGRAYFGLYDSLSFLVETRGIGAGRTNFERRVYSQETVVLSYITYTAEHADEVVATVAAAREATIEEGKTYDEDDILALYQTASGDTQTDYEGTRVQYNMDGTVYSEETSAMDLNDTIVRGRTRPTAYVLPADLDYIDDILYVMDYQGIEYYYLEPGSTAELQQYYYAGDYTVDDRDMGIEADLYDLTEVTFENGAYVFPMDQVAANVLAMLMEPDVTDSQGYDGTFYQYGLIDYDEETGDFPIYRYIGDYPRETLVSNASEGASSDEASAEASDEASGEASAEAAGSLDEAYVEYIHEFLLAELEINDTMTEDQINDEFLPLVEAGDYETFPADMLYSGMLNSGAAMTYDEFVAAGGVY